MLHDTDDDKIWGFPPRRFEVIGENGRNQKERAAFKLRPVRLPDPRTIQPRQWLYGTQLLRGYVSVLVAPGGTGKSLYAMSLGVAIATKRELFGVHVFERGSVSYCNLEDPLEELERRLAACMIKHGIDAEELRNSYYLNSSDDPELTIAKLSDNGYEIVYPDEEGLITEIRAKEIALLIVDPFAESHDLEENSNPHMVKAAKAWRRVARETGCAILLVHHVRKGVAIGIDAARGAKALTDSARVGLLMSSMSQEEARELGLDESQSGSYVRLDNPKANLAPRAAGANWFEMVSVPLDNATDSYPNGDRVAALVSWNPPTPFHNVSTKDIHDVLDKIAAGSSPGCLYSPRRGRSGSRWVGQPLTELLSIPEEQAVRMVASWLRSGLLYETDYQDPEQRKLRKGILVDNTKRPDL